MAKDAKRAKDAKEKARSARRATARKAAFKTFTKTVKRAEKVVAKAARAAAGAAQRSAPVRQAAAAVARRVDAFADGGFPIGKDTRLVVQGITGHQGQFHTRQMLAFGTKVVAGVTPGKAGEKVEGVPVFDSVADAVEGTRANASVVYVPARFAKDAVLEALDAGIRDVVVITEHIPFHDAMDFVWYARLKGARVLGPNCPGMAAPGARCKIGILPNKIFRPGRVGVASRSGTLTYEIVNALSERGVGQSGVLGLGGDPVNGTNFLDALKVFEADESTDAIVLVGEIGGTAEEEAAAYVKRHVKKPVFTYIAGRAAPEGKRMGHAGAIVSRGMGTAQSKVDAFRKAGAFVADFPTDIADAIARKG
ncbi:MAG TPA: succinate--CoA ligase subunit alpha [Candidatus Thermoplasmatota archaeon]|nr:succinate--CoA ligase subunit alpha [Candidatus Thermoplasmatota archaeon]